MYEHVIIMRRSSEYLLLQMLIIFKTDDVELPFGCIQFATSPMYSELGGVVRK